MKTSPLADAAVALGTLIACAVGLVLSLSLPHVRADPGGLALWPQVVCIIGGISAAVLLGRSAVAVARQRRPSAEAGGIRPSLADIYRRPGGRVAFCAALSIAYAALIVLLGFAVPTFLFTAVLMMFFGARPLETLLYAAALTALLHVFFFRVIGAVEPGGQWMSQLFG